MGVGVALRAVRVDTRVKPGQVRVQEAGVA